MSDNIGDGHAEKKGWGKRYKDIEDIERYQKYTTMTTMIFGVDFSICACYNIFSLKRVDGTVLLSFIVNTTHLNSINMGLTGIFQFL